jgi:hypothetical protein
MNLSELISKVGVELVAPEEELTVSELEGLGCALLSVRGSKAESLAILINSIGTQLRCPDRVAGLDDLYDKIIDLYWIDSTSKPVILMEDFDDTISKLDAFDRSKLFHFFDSIDRFWKDERLPNYSSHDECLYILRGRNLEMQRLLQLRTGQDI